jgi:hypothetical protein
MQKQKILTRIKEDNVWKYVLRKWPDLFKMFCLPKTLIAWLVYMDSVYGICIWVDPLSGTPCMCKRDCIYKVYWQNVSTLTPYRLLLHAHTRTSWTQQCLSRSLKAGQVLIGNCL